MATTIQQAELIGVLLETLLYGVYLMMSLETLEILRKKDWRKFGVAYLHISASAMLLVITLHEVIDIVRAIKAFTGNSSNPDAPGEYYSNVGGQLAVAKTAVYSAVTYISDAFIIYRTYIVWNRAALVILLPILLLIGDMVTGIAATHELTQLEHGSATFVLSLGHGVLTLSFYLLTLSLNVICTVLIAYRIWSIRLRVAPFRLRSLTSTTIAQFSQILIESCTIYSTFLCVLIATYATGSPVMFIAINLGIVFFSLINRVGRGVSVGEQPKDSGDNVATIGSNTCRVPSRSIGLNVDLSTELSDMRAYRIESQMELGSVGFAGMEKDYTRSLITEQARCTV
ncbi:hypothetical protein FOMPIDRAFT_1134522 [Fomitopsis schrenkii]|uniref:Uncharacterized protein n=1 Tax=Fomitopsis schrenkii TaxID=2126942 RepID=S8DLE5_FOMSC|nr:hypothetical protein FOMPIDRAFT_1134522 [Fomitopsis schrenkii]